MKRNWTTPLKIGPLSINNRVILAPLAGITDHPFRQVVKELGGGLTYTEMISARAVIMSNPKTVKMALIPKDQQPVAVQLFGSEPSEMAEAARICQDLGAQLIDINMGCPHRKIVKVGAGAGLMKKPLLAAEIVNKISKAVAIPVTCKIRLGWDEKSFNAPFMAKILEENGAKMIAVHARTRAQMFGGMARWDLICHVKEAVSIPVIANGDVTGPDKAIECLRKSHADGIMIGRAALGKPWIIALVNKTLKQGTQGPGPTPFELARIIKRHLELIEEYYEGNNRVVITKKHLGWYSKGLPASSSFRARLNGLKKLDSIKDELNFFINSLIEKGPYPPHL